MRTIYSATARDASLQSGQAIAWSPGIGHDGAGNIALHRKLSRSQVIVRLANGRPGIRSWNLINRMIEN